MMPEQAFVDELVDSFAQRYENAPALRESISLFTIEAHGVRKRFGESLPLRCLDLGCGPGIISRALAELGFEVIGIDPSERMIGAARHLSNRRANGCASANFIKADVAEFISIAPGPFSLIISSNVLQYQMDPLEVVKRAALHLQPGGTLAFSIPNRDSVLRVTEPWFQAFLPASLRNRKFWANELGPSDYIATLVDFDLSLERVKTFGLSAPAESVLASHWLQTMALLVFRRL